MLSLISMFNSNTKLKQSVEQIEDALREKSEKESRAYHASFHPLTPSVTDYDTEKQM